MRSKLQLAIVSGSLTLHFIGWAWVGLLGKEHHYDTVAIELAEAKKKKPEKKPPPPPPVEVKPEKKKAKMLPKPVVKQAAPPPPPEAPPPPSHPGKGGDDMSGFQDLGLSLSGGTGSDGIAVPAGGGGAGGAPAPKPAPTHRKVERLAAPADDCTEDLVKPKLLHPVQPAYTQQARQANAEGFVQLELTIDASGRVVAVKVLRSLGFGLDEAAISAAKQWTFAPATRCGKAVPTTVKPRVRFTLS